MEGRMEEKNPFENNNFDEIYSELEVNSFISEASEALSGTPEYDSWMEALYKERGRMQEKYGYMGENLEAILFGIWNKRIGYILNKYYNKRNMAIDRAISEAEQEFSETGEVMNAEEYFNGYDIDNLNPRPNPYAKELKKQKIRKRQDQ